ncbi:Small nuclear ribonucleoprotein [Rhynchospora pubera]|uniref:Small nuclear ribonucleoprotein n=1 Tax=Rhynchospora pubera TaxID=906938 RepID=A0AAV8CQ68_9POAL|nr:Small nuclear ribonucleoprotein [Rhynchospora pubera]KAJ4810272.1 Small nuclear ribonucleoprotein [Rhynchospora pubera]
MEESQVAAIDEFHTQLSTNNSSPLVGKLKKLLYKHMLIGVNDGRYFLGVFHCIDKKGNIILQEAVEYRITSRSAPGLADQRCLGLILIPAACRSSCHVDCSIEEKMSLMSLS